MSTPSAPAKVTAAIMNDPEYSRAAMAERRRWRVALSVAPTRRRFTDSRREAVEWCEEQGIPYVLAKDPRPRN